MYVKEVFFVRLLLKRKSPALLLITKLEEASQKKSRYSVVNIETVKAGGDKI